MQALKRVYRGATQFSDLPDDCLRIVVELLPHFKDKANLRLTSRRLSEGVVEVDPGFSKLRISLFWCNQQDVNKVKLILDKIANKSSFAKRRELKKLHFTVHIKCKKSKRCQHVFPLVFNVWKDCITKVEFQDHYDVQEPLSLILMRFPNIEALTLKGIRQLSHLHKLRSDNLVHLHLECFITGNPIIQSQLDLHQFNLPNLKYLTLIGFPNYLYDHILDKYADQLIGIYYKCEYVTSRRNFQSLQFFFTVFPKHLPLFLCPKLEFLYVDGAASFDLPLEMPNLKQMVYKRPKPWVSQIIRSNEQECLELLSCIGIHSSNETEIPTTYSEGDYSAPASKVKLVNPRYLEQFCKRNPVASRMLKFKDGNLVLFG